MLRLRLMTLAPVINRFVVVSASLTHQAQPMDRRMVEDAFLEATDGLDVRATLHWCEPVRTINRHGTIYERAADERGPVGSMFFQSIERQHRDYVLEAVREVAAKEDPSRVVVMVSDVDEIPNPDALVKAVAMLAADPSSRIVLQQRFHSTALDLLHPQGVWFGTTVSTLVACRPQEHRDARTTIGTPQQSVTVIPSGGWHMSWLGTDSERQRKLETFSHAEKAGWDPVQARRDRLHVNDEVLVPVSLAESWSMDWPAPLLTGKFPVPQGWLTEDCWETP